MSGSTISGNPCSIVLTGVKVLGELNAAANVNGKKPRKGRASGIGLYVRPYPLRITVELPNLYARPMRGANIFLLVEIPRSVGTLPRPPTDTRFVSGS